MNRIEKLSPTTINRIAAGEIIVSPCFAIKELLENAIDAGSSQITVTFNSLSDFTITDNGHGIPYDDLEICCERFTTSKLSHYNDLQSIQTFGFRGEALASISHVSRLTITTKTKGSQIAFKCSYLDGKMESKKPVAGNQGTIIAVKDLFYNSKTRLNALNMRKEYQQVLEVVQKYAIQYPNLNFCCKQKKVDFMSSGSQKQLMQLLYRGDFTDFSIDDGFKARGLVGPGKDLILFVNNRLVEMPMLKKAIENRVFISLEIDPTKVDVNVHPSKQRVHMMDEDSIVQKIVDTIQAVAVQESREFFVQPKLNISSQPKQLSSRPSTLVRVDSKETKLDSYIGFSAKGEMVLGKKGASCSSPIANSAIEVLTPNFPIPRSPLSSQQITINHIESTIRDSASDEDSDICGQAMLSSSDEGEQDTILIGKTSSIAQDSSNLNQNLGETELQISQSQTSLDSQRLESTTIVPISVNIQHSVQDLATRDLHIDSRVPLKNSKNIAFAENYMPAILPEKRPRDPLDEQLDATKSKIALTDDQDMDQESLDVRTWIDVNLYSIKELIQEFESICEESLTLILSNQVLVGIINSKSVLIQHETKLLMVDYEIASQELFYQLALRGFSNFGILWTDPTDLQTLFDLIQTGNDSSNTVDIIVENRMMLKEYFSIIVGEDGILNGLPNMIDGYIVDPVKLPQFVHRLVNSVDWSAEKACFKDISSALSELYSISSSDNIEGRVRMINSCLMYLKAPKHWIDTVVRQLAELNDLYKIFERC